ncbi:MAG TPA: amidase family protein, partial [Gammaproteobacteria bacterium]
MTERNSASPPAPAVRRRDLFRLAGSLAAAVPAVMAALPARAVTPRSTDKTTDLIYMSATRLAELLRAREVSAAEAVEAFIERQLAINDMLNAVVMNSYARARAEAKALDARAARGDFAGPLHGVPMTIKDSLDTQGVITTGATYGRQQYVPEKDATVVARVR